ncbi:MAG: hypothetical protein WC703_10030 [Candidatus Neomarinimicrobiota bacterium]
MNLLLKMKRALIPVFGFAVALSGQSYNLLNVFPSEKELHSVIVSADSGSLEPTAFVFSNCIRDSRNKTLLKWTNAEKLFASDDGRSFGVLFFGNPPQNPTERRDFILRTICSRDSVVVPIKGTFIPNRRSPTFVFSENCRMIAGMFPSGDQLRFINFQNDETGGFAFSQETVINTDQSRGRFSGDGLHFLFCSLISRSPLEPLAPELFMFTPIGEMLWNLKPPTGAVRSFATSFSGKFSAIGIQTENITAAIVAFQTILLDEKGNVLETFPFGFRLCDIDEKGSWIVFADENSLRLISITTRKTYFLEKTVGANRMITDVRFLPKNRFAVVTGSESFNNDNRIYNRPEISVYSFRGDVLFREKFSSDYSYTGRLLTSADGSVIGIVLQNRFITFRNKN